MKINKLIFIILISILAISNYSYSQKVTLLTDTTFVKELKKVYNRPNKKTQDSTVNVFINKWNAGEYTEENKKKIIKFCNYMNSKMFKKNIGFYSFFKTINEFDKTSKSNLNTWLKKIESIPGDSKITSNIAKFFNSQIYSLLSESAISVTGVNKWKISNRSFKFNFDEKTKKFNVKVQNTTLTGYSGTFDSIYIHNTTGVYNPISRKWKGKGGTVNWLRYGYPSSKLFVTLKDYEIDLRLIHYKVKKVKYTNKYILNKSVKGSFIDEASAFSAKDKDYPRFVSKRKDYRLKSKVKNVKLMGGIVMRGEETQTSGTKFYPATAEVRHNGKLVLYATSYSFKQSKGQLKSDKANVTLLLNNGKDTISHPQARLTITADTISMERIEHGAGKNAFYNSFHQLDIYCDKVEWVNKADSVKLYVKRGKTALFKSTDYFSEKEYVALQMKDATHPLASLRAFADEYNTNTVFLANYADYIKQEISVTEQRILRMWELGYIDYDKVLKRIVLKDKLYKQTSAFVKEKFYKSKAQRDDDDESIKSRDYDNISLLSKIGLKNKDMDYISMVGEPYYPKPCAKISKKNMDMDVYGVEKVVLSAPRKTGFYTDSADMLKIKKNRDMVFSGVLRVGYLDIEAKDMDFSYKKFKVDFNKGKMLFYYRPETDGARFQTMTSILENVDGTVEIDNPNNHSGRESYRAYPLVKTHTKSRVYYDKGNEQGNVYKRSEFYFECNKFKMKGLTKIYNEKVRIPGFLKSGSIFKNINDTLTVQEDGSLGFAHIQKDSLQLFGGTGVFKATGEDSVSVVTLSNQGFGGQGKVEWDNTTIEAENFIFFPNSLKATADSFKIAESPGKTDKYPNLVGNKVDILWDNDKKEIGISTKDKEPMKIYNNKVTFTGEAKYTKQGLVAEGVAKYEEGVIKSNNIKLNKKTFYADTCDFSMTTQSKKKAVTAKKLKAYIDTENKKAVFQAVTKNDRAVIDLHQNKYKVKADHFVWYQGKYKIDINHNLDEYTDPKKSKDNNLINEKHLKRNTNFDYDNLYTSAQGEVFFMSDKDSLQFKATNAVYKGNRIYNSKLSVRDVNKIVVADIVVAPDKNSEGDGMSKIVIREEGDIDSLTNAQIVAGEHKISKVSIKIKGRGNYNASKGDFIYGFVKEGETKPEIVHFNKIQYVETQGSSVASGMVTAKEEFQLNKYFDYKGNVQFNAKRAEIAFNGYAKARVESPYQEAYWFNFNSPINYKNVFIPLSKELLSDDKHKNTEVLAGIRTDANEEPKLNSSFLTNDKSGYLPLTMFNAGGEGQYVYYDVGAKKYRILKGNNFFNDSITGQYMDFKPKEGIINAKGEFTPVVFKNFEVKVYGDYIANLKQKDVKLFSIMFVDFFFDKNLLEQFYLQLGAAKGKSSNIHKKTEIISKAIGKDETGNFVKSLSEAQGKEYKMPKLLNHTLFFDDLSMKWDSATSSFKSFGKIGIGGVGDKLINKYFDGYIQLKLRRHTNGVPKDELHIYIKISKTDWFYFAFYGRDMNTWSSFDEYNTTLSTLKSSKTKDKERGFQFHKGGTELKAKFVNEFEYKDETDHDKNPDGKTPQDEGDGG